MTVHPPHTISTHVLDNERGQPAVGVQVTLGRWQEVGFVTLAQATTDDNGRVADLLGAALTAGAYQIRFDVAGYFAQRGGETSFMRTVAIDFEIVDTNRHYHVPLLMTRFACTSYRGS